LLFLHTKKQKGKTLLIRSGFNRLFVSIGISALLYFGLVSVAQADSRTVVIGADPWCPYICDMGGSRQGLMVDIAREALAYSDYEVIYSNINWARAKQMVLAGEIDGLVGTAKTAYTDYHFPENALAMARSCFFRRASDSWEYKSPQSLDSQTMGWINEYLFDDVPGLDEWVDAHKGTSQLVTISGTDTYARLFKLMLAGRISTFAEDPNVIHHELKRHGLLDKISIASCPGSASKVYAAFSKETGRGESLARALDIGFEKLRQDGRLDAILESYGLNQQSWMPR
jgi:polar amino acid transport system substrate-binding protein